MKIKGKIQQLHALLQEQQKQHAMKSATPSKSEVHHIE